MSKELLVIYGFEGTTAVVHPGSNGTPENREARQNLMVRPRLVEALRAQRKFANLVLTTRGDVRHTLRFQEILSEHGVGFDAVYGDSDTALPESAPQKEAFRDFSKAYDRFKIPPDQIPKKVVLIDNLKMGELEIDNVITHARDRTTFIVRHRLSDKELQYTTFNNPFPVEGYTPIVLLLPQLGHGQEYRTAVPMDAVAEIVKDFQVEGRGNLTHGFYYGRNRHAVTRLSLDIRDLVRDPYGFESEFDKKRRYGILHPSRITKLPPTIDEVVRPVGLTRIPLNVPIEIKTVLLPYQLLRDGKFPQLAGNEALIAYYPHRDVNQRLILRNWADIQWVIDCHKKGFDRKPPQFLIVRSPKKTTQLTHAPQPTA